MNPEPNPNSLTAMMQAMGDHARQSSTQLRLASAQQRRDAIDAMARDIAQSTDQLLDANNKDMIAADKKNLSPAMLDRLQLTPDRVSGITQALKTIANIPDELGEIITTLTPANGLKIDRMRVPIGVIGIIYESRPNVTADAGALCLKAGNAVILRGGSESFHSSTALHQCLVNGLNAAGLPQTAIQYVPTADRAAVGEMLGGLNGTIDLIVPRGGKSLVARVEAEARVPVLSHLDGLCHTYIDVHANPSMARDIVVNAKMRRTGICGATETVLIHKDAISECLPDILSGLTDAGCVVRGDKTIAEKDTRVSVAQTSDWDTEYLDAIVSIAVVDTLNEAINHIAKHGSGHTDCIVTDDEGSARTFLAQVDSAIVMHNASTQFADGGEFGFGAEIGIATGRLHARGPVAVEGLTTYKYCVHGTGQTRT